MRFSSDIQEVVSRREKGKSLEAPFYCSPSAPLGQNKLIA